MSAVVEIVFEGSTGSALGGYSRVSSIRCCGNQAGFGVQADRCDDEIEFIGAVDLASYAVGHVGLFLTRLLRSDRLRDDCRHQTIDADALIFGLFR